MNNGYGSGKDTRQTALRDLYVKLGGNIADVAEENDINRLIRDLGDVAGGGGGGSLVVNITQDGDSLICDKTAGEMAAALESGGIIIRRTEEHDGVTGYFYYPLSAASVAPDFHYSFTAEAPIGTLTAASASEYPANNGGK